MVFKELEIQGFKSFPDKVKISFDTGVTGVVGPNGSGKSNLSDAVRWVLGETSSRQLRAAGKMEDVIFGGTRKRSPMGFAQVRLTLDNAAHTLDVDADEVTIGRKYYRSGDSEYTINGQVCRLRDVYELLLDTGLGRCRMCVAAPAGYRDDPSRPVRVATKFVNIAKRYYASMGRDIDIIKLNGSIELAPILGLSDVIVDIVETGTTLRENGLQVVTEFMPISARFIANKASYQFKHRQMDTMLEKLRDTLHKQEEEK